MKTAPINDSAFRMKSFLFDYYYYFYILLVVCQWLAYLLLYIVYLAGPQQLGPYFDLPNKMSEALKYLDFIVCKKAAFMPKEKPKHNP